MIKVEKLRYFEKLFFKSFFCKNFKKDSTVKKNKIIRGKSEDILSSNTEYWFILSCLTLTLAPPPLLHVKGLC